jgi:fructan beta-fructosidase
LKKNNYILLLLSILYLNIAAQTYTEQHRPQFHFSPPKAWMNDPNGMVFFEGEYHLFYQYYPDDTVWGPMHWGHAVSRDMVHWEHLPIALAPDTLGYIFSGSAVIDWNNTSGFGNGKKPPMVAMFTYHNMEGEKANRTDFQYQGIAYSNDNGRNWTKYAQNPVIPNTELLKDFRDTKVFWHSPTKKWVMLCARGDRARIYTSANLKNWTQVSEFGEGMGAAGRPWECPDLFELPLENNPKKSVWVMLISLGSGAPNGGSGTQYFVGNFDGTTFVPSEKGKIRWLDYGRDNYAGVTWADIPKKDGRRLFLGWMSNWKYATKVPTIDWRSAMTIPRVLTAKMRGDSIVLLSKPVKELEKIRRKSVVLTDKNNNLAKNGELILELEAKTFDITFSNSKNETLKIGFNASKNEFYMDRTQTGNTDFTPDFSGIHTAKRTSNRKNIQLHIFIDRASIEVFADGGETVLTDIFFPNEDFASIKVTKNSLLSAKCYELNSIWVIK